jgi:hypothetical protein
VAKRSTPWHLDEFREEEKRCTATTLTDKLALLDDFHRAPRAEEDLA